MKPIRRHFTYSNALASLALFIALGGSAYAVTANSVGTKQLKNRAVTTAKIRGNAVTANKIRNNAVNVRKIRNGAVRRNKIAQGAIGPGKIASGAVTQGKIADGAVHAGKIAPGSIDRSKLNLAALGTLPSAQHAATAGAAESVVDRETFFHRLSVGEEREIASHGAVAIEVTCGTLASQTAINTRARTSLNGSILLSSLSNLSGDVDPAGFLNGTTSVGDRRMELASSPNTTVQKSGSALVLDPLGKGLIVEDGAIYLGVNYLDADCIIGGEFKKVG